MEIKDEDLDALFREKVRTLDHTYPKELPASGEIWSAIEGGLSGRRQAQKWNYRLAVAASVSVLLIAALVWLYQKPSPDTTIRYRTELATELPTNTLEMEPEEREALAFIEAQCLARQAVCQSPEFVELKSELDELTLQVQEVMKQRQTYGPSPALIKAETRLENYRAYLLRELIETLKS